LLPEIAQSRASYTLSTRTIHHPSPTRADRPFIPVVASAHFSAPHGPKTLVAALPSVEVLEKETTRPAHRENNTVTHTHQPPSDGHTRTLQVVSVMYSAMAAMEARFRILSGNSCAGCDPNPFSNQANTSASYQSFNDFRGPDRAVGLEYTCDNEHRPQLVLFVVKHITCWCSRKRMTAWPNGIRISSR